MREDLVAEDKLLAEARAEATMEQPGSAFVATHRNGRLFVICLGLNGIEHLVSHLQELSESDGCKLLLGLRDQLLPHLVELRAEEALRS